MLRSILEIRIEDKIKLNEIYSKTKAKMVGVTAKTLKLNFAGYVAKEIEEKWKKTMTMWIPNTGKRSNGRP